MARETDVLESRKQALENRANELFRQRAQLNKDAAKLAELEAEATRLGERLTGLETAEGRLATEAFESQARLDAEALKLQNDLLKLDAETSIFEERVSAYNDTLLDRGNHTAAAEANALEAERLAAEREELRNQRRRLEAERGAHEIDNEAERKRLEEREAKLKADTEKFTRESAAELSELKERAEALRQEAEALQQAKEEFTRRQTDVECEQQAREYELKQRAEALEAERVRLEAEAARLKTIAEERARLEAETKKLEAERTKLREREAAGEKDLDTRRKQIEAERDAIQKRQAELAREAAKLEGVKGEQEKLKQETEKLKAERTSFDAEKAKTEAAHKEAEAKLKADSEKLAADRKVMEARAKLLAKGKTGDEVRLSWRRFLFPDATTRGSFAQKKGDPVKIEAEPDAVRDAISKWRTQNGKAGGIIKPNDVIRIKTMQPEGWIGWGKRMAFRAGSMGVLGWRQSDSYIEIRGKNVEIFDKWIRGEISKLPADFQVQFKTRTTTWGDVIRPWRWFGGGKTLTNTNGQIDRMVNEAYESSRMNVQDAENRPAREPVAEPKAEAKPAGEGSKGESKPGDPKGEAKSGEAKGAGEGGKPAEGKPEGESSSEKKGEAKADGKVKTNIDPKLLGSNMTKPGGSLWSRVNGNTNLWGRTGNTIFGPIVMWTEGEAAWKILTSPKSDNSVKKGTTIVTPSLNGTQALTAQYDAASLEAERTQYKKDMDAYKEQWKKFEEKPPENIVLREQARAQFREREKELRGMQTRLEAPVMENETDALMHQMGVYQSTRRFRRDAAGKMVCDAEGNPIEDTFIVVDPHKYQKAATHLGKAGSGGMMLRGALQGSKPMMRAGGKVFLAFYAAAEVPDIAQKFADGDTGGALLHTGKTGVKTALMTFPVGMAAVAVWDSYDETDKVIDDLYQSLPKSGRKFVLTVPDANEPGGVRVIPTTEENMYKQFPTLAGHIMRVGYSSDGTKFPVTAYNDSNRPADRDFSVAALFPEVEKDPLSDWIRLAQKYNMPDYAGKSIYDRGARLQAAKDIEAYNAKKLNIPEELQGVQPDQLIATMMTNAVPATVDSREASLAAAGRSLRGTYNEKRVEKVMATTMQRMAADPITAWMLVCRKCRLKNKHWEFTSPDLLAEDKNYKYRQPPEEDLFPAGAENDPEMRKKAALMIEEYAKKQVPEVKKGTWSALGEGIGAVCCDYFDGTWDFDWEAKHFKGTGKNEVSFDNAMMQYDLMMLSRDLKEYAFEMGPSEGNPFRGTSAVGQEPQRGLFLDKLPILPAAVTGGNGGDTGTVRLLENAETTKSLAAEGLQNFQKTKIYTAFMQYDNQRHENALRFLKDVRAALKPIEKPYDSNKNGRQLLIDGLIKDRVMTKEEAENLVVSVPKLRVTTYEGTSADQDGDDVPLALKTFAEKFQEDFGTGFVQLKVNGKFEAIPFADMTITQKHEFLEQAKMKIGQFSAQLQGRYNTPKYIGIDTTAIGFEGIKWHWAEWGGDHDYADETVRNNWFGNKPDQLIQTAKEAITLRELHTKLKGMMDDSFGKPGSGAEDNIVNSLKGFSKKLEEHMQYLRTAEEDRKGGIAVFAHHARFMEASLSMAQGKSGGMLVASDRINGGIDPTTGQVRPVTGNKGWILYKNLETNRYYYMEGEWDKERFTATSVIDRATGEVRKVDKTPVNRFINLQDIMNGSLVATEAHNPGRMVPPKDYPGMSWNLRRTQTGHMYYVIYKAEKDTQGQDIRVPHAVVDYHSGSSRALNLTRRTVQVPSGSGTKPVYEFGRETTAPDGTKGWDDIGRMDAQTRQFTTLNTPATRETLYDVMATMRPTFDFSAKVYLEVGPQAKAFMGNMLETQRTFAHAADQAVQEMPALFTRYNAKLPGKLLRIEPVFEELPSGSTKIYGIRRARLVFEGAPPQEIVIHDQPKSAMSHHGVGSEHLKAVVLSHYNPNAALRYHTEKAGIQWEGKGPDGKEIYNQRVQVRQIGKDENGAFVEMRDDRSYTWTARGTEEMLERMAGTFLDEKKLHASPDKTYRVYGKFVTGSDGKQSFVAKGVRYKDKDGKWTELKTHNQYRKDNYDDRKQSKLKNPANPTLGEYGLDHSGITHLNDGYATSGGEFSPADVLAARLREHYDAVRDEDGQRQFSAERNRLHSVQKVFLLEGEDSRVFSGEKHSLNPRRQRHVLESNYNSATNEISLFVQTETVGGRSADRARFRLIKALPDDLKPPADWSDIKAYEAFMKKVNELPVVKVKNIDTGHTLDLRTGTTTDKDGKVVRTYPRLALIKPAPTTIKLEDGSTYDSATGAITAPNGAVRTLSPNRRKQFEELMQLKQITDRDQSLDKLKVSFTDNRGWDERENGTSKMEIFATQHNTSVQELFALMEGNGYQTLEGQGVFASGYFRGSEQPSAMPASPGGNRTDNTANSGNTGTSNGQAGTGQSPDGNNAHGSNNNGSQGNQQATGERPQPLPGQQPGLVPPALPTPTQLSPGMTMLPGGNAPNGGMPVAPQGQPGAGGQMSDGQLPNSGVKLLSAGRVHTFMPDGQPDTKQAYSFEMQNAPGQPPVLVSMTGRVSGKYLVIDTVQGAPLMNAMGQPSGRIIVDMSKPQQLGNLLNQVRQNPAAFITDIERMPRQGLSPMLPDGTVLPADPALLPQAAPLPTAGNISLPTGLNTGIKAQDSRLT